MGSLGEQLLGRGDSKRSTKTYIETGSLAMLLGMFRGLPDMVINATKRLHAEEFGGNWKNYSTEFMFEEYPELREIIAIHQFIIEHKGSQEGYLVDRFTRGAGREEMEQKEEKKESSGGSSDSSPASSRWQ